MPTLDAIQQLMQPLFPGLMGVRLTELTPERVVAEMLVRPDLCTAGGILHGGAYMAFADTLGAVGTVVNLQGGKRTEQRAPLARKTGRPALHTGSNRAGQPATTARRPPALRHPPAPGRRVHGGSCVP